MKRAPSCVGIATLILALAAPVHLPAVGAARRRIALEPGERVFSGAVKQGHLMPLAAPYRFDFYANNDSNQIQPLVLGTRGLWIWSEEPFAFEVTADAVLVDDPAGAVRSGRSGTTLAEARRHAAAAFFPASGKMPDPLLFERPQYNTWIELTHDQNQTGVLEYARAILANGFPPGVFMIDDTWQEDYGLWRFHPGRFPDPKAMVAELHRMGFKVMVWVCPFVSPDQFRLYDGLRKKRALLLEAPADGGGWDQAKEPAIVRWWNGASAVLDFTSPPAVEWFSAELRRIADEYGVDGFKFDAADMPFYPPSALSRQKVTPNRHTELYARFGLDWPLNEFRAGWKMAGQPLAQRLHDKMHSWEDLGRLVPHMLVESLSGYTFACPDLIGGGDFTSFLDRSTFDQELVVRSAQTHALMPMMQFSVAPWRILDARHLAAVKAAVALREAHVARILDLARASAKTGEPIVSSLEYVFPHEGLEDVKDEFLLGPDLLVAPMVEKGTRRTVRLPKGRWVADDGREYSGGAHVIEVPLERLPRFRRVGR